MIFVVPTVLSFYYSLTRWTLFDTEFIGLDNFFQFFQEPALTMGARNTIIYAVVTSGLKVVIGLLLATALTSRLRVRHMCDRSSSSPSWSARSPSASPSPS